jgi:hypothetical protein
MSQLVIGIVFWIFLIVVFFAIVGIMRVFGWETPMERADRREREREVAMQAFGEYLKRDSQKR